MKMQQKKTSIWLFLSLAIIVVLFIAFILFLDRNVVKMTQQDQPPASVENNTEQPVFDFYTVLPQRKVDIPDIEAKTKGKPSKHLLSPKKSSTDQYLMQVGSYQTMRDADHQKAQLAMLGLEASITTARVNGSTYYRVQMGPYDARQYSSVQKRLIENEVDFLPKKVR